MNYEILEAILKFLFENTNASADQINRLKAVVAANSAGFRKSLEDAGTDTDQLIAKYGG